jgi:outer membrane protein assembly factor BamB
MATIAWCVVGGTVPIEAAAAPQQQEVVPSIADSPTAQTLFDDARAQAAANPAEAARLARRLLDEYSARVARADPETQDLFASVADLTDRFLLEHPAVLERFRDSESRAAERLLADEGADVVATRRRWTRAGLVATLTLAERALIADRAEESLALLRRVDRHPDLAGRELVAHLALTAAALRRMGASADDSFARLEELSRSADFNPDLREDLAHATAQARATAPRDRRTRVRSPLIAGSITETPDASWREIWSVDLDGTLFRRLFDGPITAISPRVVERARNDASWMTAAPTIVGRTIYVSEGQRVRAIDADSRDQLWSRDLGAPGIDRDTGGVGDLSALAVDANAIVAYEGHAFAASRSGPSRIWCLDPIDGRSRWSIDLDGHEGREDFTGLFPVGAPLLFDSAIVVCARKSTQRLEQVDWLVALNRDDGSVRWATSIAGAPGMRIIMGRRHAGMVADGDAVVVSTPLGVTARVRIGDGAIEWLRRVSVPLRESRSGIEPWEAAHPVVAAGKVLTFSPDGTEVVALDHATGRLLGSRPIGPETAWSEPRYLVATELPQAEGGGDNATPRAIVLAVGSDIVAFDARDLETPLWRFSKLVRDAGIEREGMDSRSGVRGRVSVAGSGVLVPGLTEFVVLDLASGAIRARIPGQGPANAVLADDRIVAAGDDALRVLMPPARAESILRERLAAFPNDPGTALALMELARATARPALALEAATTARDALRRAGGSDAVREGLLEELIALADESPEQGEAAYALIADVADTPRLRVRALLARGDFLRANGAPRDAVRVWSDLAADPALGLEFVERTGVARAARTEAITRVARAAARDAEITARLDDDAARALAEQRAQGADVDALLAFANLHPRTAAAADAVLAAAPSLGVRRTSRALEALLADLLVPPARVELADRVAAALAAVSAAEPNPQSLMRIERRVAELLVASGLERAQLTALPTRLPRVGLVPGTGRDLRARLARFAGSALKSRRPDLLLVIGDGALQRLDLTSLDPTWRLRLDDRDPVILHAGERIVVWQSAPNSGETALIVDSATGAVERSTPRLDEMWMGAARQSERPGASTGPDGAAFVSAQVLPLCDGPNLILVRRSGDLARYAVAEPTAEPVLVRGILEQVFAASMHDGFLTLAGRAVGASDLRPTVCILDAATLEERVRIEPESGEDVRWAFATAIGEIFLGTAMGVERWTMGVDGIARPVLVTRATSCGVASGPNLLGANLMLLDRNDQPLRLPIFEGEPEPIELPIVTAFGFPSLRSLLPLAEGLLIHAENRLLLRGHGADSRGVDMMAGDLNLVFTLATESGLIALNGLGGRQTAGPGLGNFRVDFPYVAQFLSPRAGLRLSGLPFEVTCPNQRADRAFVVDGWLLLSSSQGTVAVALPTGEPPDSAGAAKDPAPAVNPDGG